MITVRLGSAVDYSAGQIRPRMQGAGRNPPTSAPVSAELVERVTGWGESDVLVRYGADEMDTQTYLATEIKSNV